MVLVVVVASTLPSPGTYSDKPYAVTCSQKNIVHTMSQEVAAAPMDGWMDGTYGKTGKEGVSSCRVIHRDVLRVVTRRPVVVENPGKIE